MSNNPLTFTTILGWCKQHNCQSLEITNESTDLVSVKINYRAYNIILSVDTTTSLSKLSLEKLVDGLKYSLIFEQEKLTFEQCLKIIENKVIL